MNLNKIIQDKLAQMEGQEIDLNMTLKLDSLTMETAENQKKKKKQGKPWVSCRIMAILNSNNGGNSSSQSVSQNAQDMAQGQAQSMGQASTSQSVGGPGDALNQGSSLLGDANQFLQQINQLMENPVVKSKINQKMNGGQAQQRGEPVMDETGQVSRGQAPAPEPSRAPKTENAGEKKKETPEIKPEDLDLFEIFQAKIFDPEQREEMAQDLDKVGQVLQDELNGMNTTLEELQEYLRSDELQEYFEQMGIDQWNQKNH